MKFDYLPAHVPSHMIPPGPLKVYPATFGARGMVRMIRPNGWDQCLAQVHEDWATVNECGGILECTAPGVWNYLNPPWLAMPVQGRRFRKNGGIGLPTDANPTPILTFRVQPGYEGVIKSLVVLVTNSAATGFGENSGDLVWRVQVGRSYAKDLGNITTTLGSLSAPFPLDQGMRIYPGQDITLWVERPNFAADSLDPGDRLLGMLTGYFYPVHVGYLAQAQSRGVGGYDRGYR